MVTDKNIGQGAATTLFAALCPDLKSGSYLSDCALKVADAEGEDATKVKRRALWAKTAEDVEAAIKKQNI